MSPPELKLKNKIHGPLIKISGVRGGEGYNVHVCIDELKVTICG